MSCTPEEHEQTYAVARRIADKVHRISELTMIPQQKIVGNVVDQFFDTIKNKEAAK